MPREFATGVRFAVVSTLPAAASSAGVVLEQGGKLWFSDGAAWVDLGAGGGGGGIAWSVVTAGQTLVADGALLAVITTTQNFPLPASPTAGQVFIVANARGSTAGALARIQTGASQQIVGTAAAGDDVTVAPGETIYLVARSSTLLEIV
ncbi:MAG TPA: hypothetical protein VFH17_01410 [Coriobacteriia bacterium]|nr:hypothetical protein [Coriobacteriia bacterium]